MVTVLMAGLLSSCSFRRKKYENPITKDTQQPDKMLLDKAMKDIERGRYDIARLTLQTMISTYDTSEFLAKAKLMVADSWFREGGTNGLAQAEAEYKDFILFYPTLDEAAEAQEKVCRIEYNQMDKPDRDMEHALRADEECRQVLGPVPQQPVRPGRAAVGSPDPGGFGRKRIPRGGLLSQQGRSRSGHQPAAGHGRPLSVVQQG